MLPQDMILATGSRNWRGGRFYGDGSRTKRESNEMSWSFEPIAGPVGFAEGPAWDGTGLLFSDISNSRVMRYDDTSGETTVFREGTNEANGLMLDAEGRLYACEGGGRRVVRYEPDGQVTVLADRFEDGEAASWPRSGQRRGNRSAATQGGPGRFNSPNDLAIDAWGRVWFSDPRYGDQ